MNRQLVHPFALLPLATALAVTCPCLAATRQVEVGPGLAFSPAVVTIQPGDTVTWVWKSGPHNTRSTAASAESWRSGDPAGAGTEFSHTFATAGVFPYVCEVHGPGMAGTIRVSDPDSPLGSLKDPIPRKIETGAVTVQLTPVVPTGSLNAPVWGVAAPGDDAATPARLFVADQTGILWNVDLVNGQKTQFGDFSTLMVSLGVAGPGSYDERGLLGFAFHPDYPSNGLLYTYTSEPASGTADFPLAAGVAVDHQSVIREWKVNTPAEAAAAIDPASTRVLLRIDQPQFNHNGGALAFGADRMLYIALGDGGNADDEGDGHNGRKGNGQDRATVLGKILRIDPSARTAANQQYGVPADNPFLPRRPKAPLGGGSGCTADGRCDEIYAYGLRNPFRIAFDSASGALYAGDVGQNSVEEIDVIRRGGNYGWRRREGRFCFHPNGNDRNGYVTRGRACASPRLIDPVAQYDHDEGSAVIGGFVYRGTAIPALTGHYVFGDYQHDDVGKGRLFYLVRDELVKGRRIRSSGIAGLGLAAPLADSTLILGFARDAGGELYLLTNTSGVPAGGTGAVWKIQAAP